MIRTRVQTPRSTPVPPPVLYRVTALPSGRLLPIEVRVGRRLLRTIAVDSSEGRALLREGRVEIVTGSVAGRAAPPAPSRDH